MKRIRRQIWAAEGGPERSEGLLTGMYATNPSLGAKLDIRTKMGYYNKPHRLGACEVYSIQRNEWRAERSLPD